MVSNLPKSKFATSGAKIGRIIKVISTQSRKNPSKNVIPINKNNNPQDPSPASAIKSSTI